MIIDQPASIGDILFIEPIVKSMVAIWQHPVLPVRDHLYFLGSYLDIPIDKLSKYSPDFLHEQPNNCILNLRHANQIMRNHPLHYHDDYENCMPDKYTMAGLPLHIWTSLNINFNYKKGIQLYKELGLKEGEKYILINNHSQAGTLNIKVQTKYKVVKMEFISDYNVLDWWYVMLKAQENHHVSTCTFFIFQAIANQYILDSKIFIYPRPGPDGLRGISKLNPTFKFIKCE